MAARRAPTNQLDVLLVDLWSEELGRRVGIDDSLAKLGATNEQRARLMTRVARELGRAVPTHEWDPPGTIAALAAVMVQMGMPDERGAGPAGGARPRAFTRHPDGTRPPLFFLHGDLNGGGYYCLNLATRLGSAQPLHAIDPHGLHGVPVPPTIEAMAEDQLVTLRSLQPTGPYRLAGHCNGGLVAFEMACRLETQGERVSVLVLIAADVRSRSVPSGPDRSWSYLLGYYGQRLRRLVLPPASPPAADSRGARALAERRRTHTERLAVYGQVLRAYVPHPYAGRVILLWPREEPIRHPGDATQGWGSVAPNLAVWDIPGGHLSCVTTHAGAVAAALGRALDPA